MAATKTLYQRFGTTLAWAIGVFMLWTVGRIWLGDMSKLTFGRLLLPIAVLLAGASGVFGDSRQMMIIFMGGLLLYVMGTMVFSTQLKFDSKTLMLWQAGAVMAVMASVFVQSKKPLSAAGVVLWVVIAGFAGHMLVFPERWEWICKGTGRHRCTWSLKKQ